MTQYPAVIELSTLDGGNGFRFDGVSQNEHSGISVAAAGDINGDGFADIIVGAPHADSYNPDPDRFDSGGGYVVFGKAGGFAAALDAATLDASDGFRLRGLMSEFAGNAVASAGDVNGDGFADLIVGAPAGGPNDAGCGYVLFGKAAAFAATVDLATLDGADGFRLDGESPDDLAGASVASAGDVNGDGYGDLIVGAPRAGPNGAASGSSYVVFGKPAGFAAVLDLAALDGGDGFRLDGSGPYDRSGSSVASAGDINGDGFADVIVGAFAADPRGAYSGAAYVVFGKAAGFAATLDLAALDGGDGFRIEAAAGPDHTGCSVASAGDVNGDGFADLIVGAVEADPNGARSGSSYVVFGKAAGFASMVDLSGLDGRDGFRLDGVAYSTSGGSVASAGDVNGDGFADLVVGAGGFSTDGANEGATYVMFGKASGFAATLDLAALDGTEGFRIDGAAAADSSGGSVASAGDVNGDGLDDLIVGAAAADPHGEDSGSSFVVLGRLPDAAVVRSGTEASQSLVGGDLDDVLKGRGGDDRLWGHEGADKAMGGRGQDTIIGAGGADRLGGQGGADTFLFQAASDSPDRAHADIIKDLGSSDLIDLSAIDADTTVTGHQAFHLAEVFGHEAGELVLSVDDKGRHSWLEGDTDGDGVADFAVRLNGDQHAFAGFVL